MISFEDDFAFFDGFSREDLVEIIRGYRIDCEKAESELETAKEKIRKLEALVRKYCALYTSWKRAGIKHGLELKEANRRVENALKHK